MYSSTTISLSSTLRYDPFWMIMFGRSWSVGGDYRYGFNGKESDSETYGDGNIYDYGFRIYNPRLGKFLSVDPLTRNYSMLTPYQFASNRPIDGIDLDGLEYLRNEEARFYFSNGEIKLNPNNNGNVYRRRYTQYLWALPGSLALCSNNCNNYVSPLVIGYWDIKQSKIEIGELIEFQQSNNIAMEDTPNEVKGVGAPERGIEHRINGVSRPNQKIGKGGFKPSGIVSKQFNYKLNVTNANKYIAMLEGALAVGVLVSDLYMKKNIRAAEKQINIYSPRILSSIEWGLRTELITEIESQNTAYLADVANYILFGKLDVDSKFINMSNEDYQLKVEAIGKNLITYSEVNQVVEKGSQ